MTSALPKLNPRPHSLLIHLWADGHSVYFLSPDHTWVITLSPQWNTTTHYAVKLTNHILTSDGLEYKLIPSTPDLERTFSNGTA